MNIQASPTVMGLHIGADCLVLNKRERAALRRASAIAEQARALLEERYGLEALEATSLDMLLADVEHGSSELIEASVILLPFEVSAGGES